MIGHGMDAHDNAFDRWLWSLSKPGLVRAYVAAHRGSVELVPRPGGAGWCKHAFFEDRQDAVKFVEWCCAMDFYCNLSVQTRRGPRGERYGVYCGRASE
jgi:hypothetical protein